MHHLVRMVLSFVMFGLTPVLIGVAWSFPPPNEITVKELIPLAAWQKQFKITEGKDRGKVVPLVFHHDQSNDQRWQMVFGDYAGIVMVNDSTGALVMERLDLFKSRSTIVYDPALLILPRDVASGAAVRRQAGFKMYDRATGKLKRTGVASHMVKQVSYSRFDTPSGPIDGYYVEIEHWMDMRFAQLHLTLGLGCRLDEGPVYGSGHYRIQKLGIFSETKTAVAALVKR